MNLKSTTEEIARILDEKTTKSNKELLLVAGVCTLIGIFIGIIFGKASTSHNTVKKYNQCYSYDFGDEE